MTTMELRNVLSTALGEARTIEAKTEAVNRTANRGIFPSAGSMLLCLGLFFGGTAIIGIIQLVMGIKLPIAAVIILETLGAVSSLIIFLKNVISRTKSFKQIGDEEIRQLLQNATALPSIPADYCSSLALAYMIDLLDKGRATTWAECADKYEEQVHRWTLEANSAEAAAYAKSAASAARWAAIGAWSR